MPIESWPRDEFKFFELWNKFYIAELLADGFSCPDGETVGPNGRALPHPTFAHPEDCRLFYICRNGVVPQHGSCPEGDVYNEDSFKCDEPTAVPGWWLYQFFIDHISHFYMYSSDGSLLCTLH